MANATWFTKYLLIAVGVVLGVAFLVYAHSIVLVIFASILLAVFLDGLANLLSSHSRFSRGWSLVTVVAVILLLVIGTIWLLGPRLVTQMSQLSELIPKAVQQLEATLEQNRIGRLLLPQQPQRLLPNGNVMGRITGMFSTTLGAFTYFFVIILTGIYIAVDPRLYINGLFHLVPKDKRSHMWTIFTKMGHALRWWLVGRFASMAIVGGLTALALYIAGVPLALTLGLIAAILSFVPLLGPILSLVPALLVALVESIQLALYVTAIYIVVQLVETYLVTPLVQERTVAMPPALLLNGQVILGYLAGAIGVFLATPLLVSLMVAVQILYVEEEIGDSVHVLGE